MNTTIEKKLNNFLFPVGERAVFVDDDKTYKPTKHYKAIVNESNGKLISIMKDSYKLVDNRTVILPLLALLAKAVMRVVYKISQYTRGHWTTGIFS